jgi:hypothetical protein
VIADAHRSNALASINPLRQISRVETIATSA